MITYLRFRLQRIVHRYGRLFRQGWQVLLRYIRFNLFGKWRQFAMIRRFALGWSFLVLASMVGLVWQVRSLTAKAVVLQPLPGGSYSEAVVGGIKTINPILPEGSASADATHLIFSGLTRFNTSGELEPDLAKSWSVSSDGKTYTFHLRKGVKWHDGVPFTAQDVVFTLTAIQNPDTRSPLAASWQGVHVGAPDDYTVVFTLPKPYTPFIDATTVGLLPRHLLENTEPSSLRVSQFNQRPVGTGPFKLSSLEATAGELNLSANTNYYLGKPLLDSVTLRLYDSYSKAFEAYSHRQVQGVARLQPDQVAEAHHLGTLKVYDAAVPDQVAAFFKTTVPGLADKNVRMALAEATNRQAIIHDQLNDEATALTSPLPASHLNMAGAQHQPSLDLGKANALLDAGGWKRGGDGVRSKDGVRLEFQLVTQTNTPYVGVAEALKQQWQKVGVLLNVKQVEAASLQQSYIRPRHYDILLYGINVGSDPDVYAFWDSSQINDPGLNLSVYKSAAADQALEGGRIVRDNSLRAAKYRSFVQAFVADNPAVMLYTPVYEYGVDSGVYGLSIHKLINPSDRFTGIEKWSVRVRHVRAH